MVADQGENIFRIALVGMLFAATSGGWSVDVARRMRDIAKGNVLTHLWHGEPVFSQPLVKMAHNLDVVTLTCQVVFIHALGALYKAGGKPWQDGAAVYAPLHVTRFAPWPELSEITTAWAPAVAAIGLGSALIQLFFPGVVLFRWMGIPILFAMIGFHAGIDLFMGLPWCSLAMVAIDSIFVRAPLGSALRTGSKRPGVSSPRHRRARLTGFIPCRTRAKCDKPLILNRQTCWTRDGAKGAGRR